MGLRGYEDVDNVRADLSEQGRALLEHLHNGLSRAAASHN